jgi:RNA polymerase sigma-32 factor
MWWIKATIQDYILKSWSLVKIGTSALHKKIFFNLKRVKDKLMHVDNESVDNLDKAISLELGVSEDQIKMIGRGFDNGMLSLQDQMNEDSDQDRMSSFVAEDDEKLEDAIIDLHDKNKKLNNLSNAMMNLSDREREVILARQLSDEPMTLQDLSLRYGVSRERIRQIEERAIEKIKISMEKTSHAY